MGSGIAPNLPTPPQIARILRTKSTVLQIFSGVYPFNGGVVDTNYTILGFVPWSFSKQTAVRAGFLCYETETARAASERTKPPILSAGLCSFARRVVFAPQAAMALLVCSQRLLPFQPRRRPLFVRSQRIRPITLARQRSSRREGRYHLESPSPTRNRRSACTHCCRCRRRGGGSNRLCSESEHKAA